MDDGYPPPPHHHIYSPASDIFQIHPEFLCTPHITLGAGGIRTAHHFCKISLAPKYFSGKIESGLGEHRTQMRLRCRVPRPTLGIAWALLHISPCNTTLWGARRNRYYGILLSMIVVLSIYYAKAPNPVSNLSPSSLHSSVRNKHKYHILFVRALVLGLWPMQDERLLFCIVLVHDTYHFHM